MQSCGSVARGPFEDQRRLSGPGPLTIFDVGAHVGQSSMKYANLFRDSEIYAFEPNPEAFAHLEHVASLVPSIHPTKVALSASAGAAAFHRNVFDQTNSLLAVDRGAEKTWGGGLSRLDGAWHVETMTLDGFMASRGLATIDILKLDTQGSEGLVLDGARTALERGAIGMVYTEIITMPTYVGQVGLLGILSRLEKYGFSLYYLYNLSTSDSGRIRQMDGLFVHSSHPSQRGLGPSGLAV